MKLKSFAAETNKGPYLQVNEDLYEVDVINQLYMILDGFGGSGIGDKVVQEIKDYVKSFYTKISQDPDSTMPFYYSNKYVLEGNALLNAMYHAHRLVCKNNAKIEMNKRAGASAVMISQSEDLLTIASTGNCAAYLYRKGQFNKVLIEDSMRFLSKDDFDLNFKTAPLSAFGLFDDIYIQTREIKLNHNDLVIFATDGAYGRALEQEFKYIFDKTQNSLAEKIKQVFDLNNLRGNLDNQTMLILEF
ncbi:MAG: hypothetical protein U0T83_04930 [Bacteriovoracaceae bacterium]